MTLLPLVLAGASWAGDDKDDQKKDGDLPLPLAARPIAIGSYNLELGIETGLAQDVDPGVLLALPLRFGLSKDLELFGTGEYRTVQSTLRVPRLGAIYRVIDTGVELGITAYTDVFVSGTEGMAVVAGFPLRIHATNMLAVDTGLLGQLTLIPAKYTGVQVPLGVTLNPTHGLFLNVQGALRLGDVTALDTEGAFTIPLTTAIGFSLPSGDSPLVDLGVRANWSDLQTADVLDVVAFAHFFVL